MQSIDWIRKTICSFMLVTSLATSGCGGGAANNDTALYQGDEEATREHMQEVEDEERAHFQQSPQQAQAQVQTDGE